MPLLPGKPTRLLLITSPRVPPACSILHDIVNFKELSALEVAQSLGPWSYRTGPPTVGTTMCASTNVSEAPRHKYQPVQQFEEVGCAHTDRSLSAHVVCARGTADTATVARAVRSVRWARQCHECRARSLYVRDCVCACMWLPCRRAGTCTRVAVEGRMLSHTGT